MKRYLGLDLGTKTLGVSVSDITNTIATTVGIIRFDSEDYEKTYEPLNELKPLGRLIFFKDEQPLKLLRIKDVKPSGIPINFKLLQSLKAACPI